MTFLYLIMKLLLGEENENGKLHSVVFLERICMVHFKKSCFFHHYKNGCSFFFVRKYCTISPYCLFFFFPDYLIIFIIFRI